MRGSGIDNVLPRVTVMVPTYNQAEFLEDAVASALAQDYPDLEVVISDDGSTDQTPAVVERLAARDPRVRAHRSARNIGRVANYRRLLNELATGDWVINLDGDDCFASPTYLGAAVRRALSDPAIALVFGKARKGASLSGAATLLNDGADLPPVMDGTEFFRRFPPFETIVPLHATCLYHRASALAVGFYTQDILSSDFESLYRLMLGAKVGFVDEVAALWRQHGGNATAAPSLDALLSNAAVFEGPYRRAVELGCLPRPELDAWLLRRRARYIVSLSAQAARRGLPPGAAIAVARDLLGRDWRAVLHLAPALAQAWRDRRPPRRSRGPTVGRR